MSGSTVTVLYFLVILKIPVLSMIALLFWAARRPEADPDQGGGEDGGSPHLPHWPRRGGPHGAPPPVEISGPGRKRLRPEKTRVIDSETQSGR